MRTSKGFSRGPLSPKGKRVATARKSPFVKKDPEPEPVQEEAPPEPQSPPPPPPPKEESPKGDECPKKPTPEMIEKYNKLRSELEERKKLRDQLLEKKRALLGTNEEEGLPDGEQVQ